jgi:hypothetical protein
VNGIARAITFLAALTALSSILASVLGAHAILIALASSIVASIPIARRLQVRHKERVNALQLQEQAWSEDRRQHQEAAQRDATLRAVPVCADLQQRALSAVDVIQPLADHVNGLLIRPIDVHQLQSDLREISDKLYRIAGLAIRRASIATEARSQDPPPDGGTVYRYPLRGSSPGPMTAAALKAQEPALNEVLDSIVRRVASLEEYAKAVAAVDDSHRDFLGAEKTRRLNEEIHELRVDTPRDEIAAEYLRSDADMIDTTRRAFESAVLQADLAGEALASGRQDADQAGPAR